MNDLISRQAAIEAVGVNTWAGARIMQLPPANCSEFPNSSDTISRQAAIDAITQYLGRIKRDFKQWEGTARIILDHVPSAQPKERTEERTETHACDLISRQAAIDEAKHYIEIGYDSDIIHTLENLPSAYVRENVHGEWIDDYDPMKFGEFRYKCSKCGARTVEWADNFCFNCGADMRGEEDDTV